MRKLLAVGLVLLLLFAIGCAPARSARQTKATPAVETRAEAAAPTNETPDGALDQDNATDDGIRVRRLNDTEVEYITRTTQEGEDLREKRYGTRVDLTELDAFNCRAAIEDLEAELDRLADDVDELEEELDRKRHEADQAEQAYQDALGSGDDYEIKAARFDYNDAENEYDEVKKEAKQAHDDYDETERTKKVVEAECVRMRKDARLED